jgi:hypothetical protein
MPVKIDDEVLFIMFDNVEQYGFDEHKLRLINILSASLKGHSGYARNELIKLWDDIEADISLASEPPTEEQLSLEHPEMFDVE